MIKKSAFPALRSYRELTHFLVKKSAIMNWSTLDKCILMLVLGSLIHIAWIIWKVYIILNPSVWLWVDMQLIHTQIIVNGISLGLFLGLIYWCRHPSSDAFLHNALPYISVGILVISLCRDGYLVGVLSPATMISYVCLVTVGLVLFNRTLVYAAMIPATLFLFGAGILSFFDYIPYGPLFNFYGMQPYENGFWILSMLFFISPMMLTCLILFEILLSQWRYREKLIRRLSQLDPLTNLFNRRSINRYLNQFDMNQEKSYAVILIDLDHFKSINDRFGHHKGDEALILVAEALALHLRESDVVGRFGGEEFILLLKNTDQKQAVNVAERCRNTIQHIILLDDRQHSIHITASFGIAISEQEIRPQQLLTNADQALYAAKAAGRNCVRCYSELDEDTAEIVAQVSEH